MKFSKQKIGTVTLKSIRIVIYCLGIISCFAYFFSFIALIIGLVYFVSFKNRWRWNGFVLSLTSSLVAFGTLRGLVELTGIYPLFLAVILTLIIQFVYFISIPANKFLNRYESYESFKKKIGLTRLKQINLSKFGKLVFVSSLILAPIILWMGVNINFGVMFNNKATLLWVHAPSTVATDTTFTVTVQAWDKYERDSATYEGTVNFELESYDLTTLDQLSSVTSLLPEPYTFTGRSMPSDIAYMLDNGKDNGLHRFQIRINTPGIHYILVSDSFTGETFYSNPIIVQDFGLNIYWGDIHSHSIYSDGSGTPDHSLFYAQNIASLDFFALTEHGEIIQMADHWLEDYIKKTNEANQPGEFVTFLGMEFTNHKTGHYTCIFDGSQLPQDPLISSRKFKSPYELWNVLDNFNLNTGSRTLALPHHCVEERFLQDWSYYNPDYVKIAEVTSTHGDSLFDPHHELNYRGMYGAADSYINGSSIIDALKMGLKLSLYASSDSHDGHPGHTIAHTDAFIGHQRPMTYWLTRFDKPYPGGITAVYAPELTRSSIFSQLEDRFIYANSDFGRPIVNFTINGIGVGGNSTVQVADPNVFRDIDIFIAQDGAPASSYLTAASITDEWVPNWKAAVEIIKNGQLINTFFINSPLARINFLDTEPITGASYGRESCIQIGDDYFINEYSDNPLENPDELQTYGVDFYLIRIVCDNGRHTYIGPIWVESVT